MPRATSGISSWFRTHPHLSVVAYLTGAGALVAFLIADALVFGLGDDAVRWWSQRWVQRIDAAEEVLDQGHHDRAIAALASLDAEFPARHAKHALDRDRERLLAMLARAYEAAEKPRLARETLQRLTDFDPRNHRSHYALADCLIRQGRAGEAELPLRNALAINPAHVPALAALISHLSDAKRHTEAIAIFESYVDATEFAQVTLELGAQTTTAAIPTDGNFHRFVRPLAGGVRAPEPLTLRTDGFATALGMTRISPPQFAGKMTQAESIALPPTAWSPQEMIAEHAVFRPRSDSAALVTTTPVTGMSGIEVELRLLKPVPRSTWDAVEQSYRSELQLERLEEIRDRVALVEDAR